MPVSDEVLSSTRVVVYDQVVMWLLVPWLSIFGTSCSEDLRVVDGDEAIVELVVVLDEAAVCIGLSHVLRVH